MKGGQGSLWKFGIVPQVFPDKFPCPVVLWEMLTVDRMGVQGLKP